MSGCVTKAAGHIKRANGDFTPASGVDFYAADELFLKTRPVDSVRMIGGGAPGAQPAEQGRFLFGPCRPCDVDLCIADVSTFCPLRKEVFEYGLAVGSVGRAIVKVSRSPSFDSGYYAQLEAVATPLQIPERPPRVSMYGTTLPDFLYDLRLSDSPVNDSNSYVTAAWPSLFEVSSGMDFFPARFSPEFGFWVPPISIPGSLFGSSFFFGQGLSSLRGRALTFLTYRVSVGEFAGTSFSPYKTQSTWASCLDLVAAFSGSTSPSVAKLWLGFGESSICAGLSSYCVVRHALSSGTINEWRTADKYYAGDALPGVPTEITITQPEWYLTTAGNGPYQSAGLGILSAQGWSVDAKKVMLSPKASASRSSLVTSAQDLLWAGGVFSGANAAHSRRAMVGYSTPWPFNQPEHSSAISAGSQAASATKLRVAFECNPTNATLLFSTDNGLVQPPFNADPTLFLKPHAIVHSNPSVLDEAGQYSATVKQRPQNSPFAGVFDVEDNFVESLSQFDIISYGSPATWETKKFDSYRLEIEPITFETKPHLFFHGSFDLENKMPNGDQSFSDVFSCTKQNDGPTLQAVPSTQWPFFTAVSGENNWTTKTSATGSQESQEFGGGARVEQAAAGLPRIVPKSQVIGRRGGGLGTTQFIVETGVSYVYENTTGFPYYGALPGAAGWEAVQYSYDATATGTKTTIEATRTQEIQRYYSINAPSTTPPAPSEFRIADPTRLDDAMQRACDATRWSVVKSCKWIPKQTQIFSYLRRNSQQAGFGSATAQWPFYGGDVAGDDQPQLLDQSSVAQNQFLNPGGASLFIAMRRTWEIEAEVAHGTLDYTPAEIVSDSPSVRGPIAEMQNVSTPLGVRWVWENTRRVRYSVEFNTDNCETVTHKTNQEAWWRTRIELSEAETQQLENGQELEIGPDRVGQWSLGKQMARLRYQAQAGLTVKLRFA